jgi:hypothetical protein
MRKSLPPRIGICDRAQDVTARISPEEHQASVVCDATSRRAALSPAQPVTVIHLQVTMSFSEACRMEASVLIRLTSDTRARNVTLPWMRSRTPDRCPQKYRLNNHSLPIARLIRLPSLIWEMR